MELKINSLEEIGAVAEEFVRLAMQEDTVFAFNGQMGAGKTTFIKALCEALGVSETVTSPTFAIVNEYRADESGELIYHFDFYRIKRLEEVYDMGYEDYFYGEGVTLIEWANLIEEILPEHYTSVTIEKDLEKGFDYRRISVCEF